jgi:uncharacterized membrane protein
MEQAVGTKSKKTLIIIFEAVMVLTLLILGVFTIALNPTKLRIGYGVMIFLFVIGEGVHFATRVYSFYGKDPEKVHRIRGFGDLFISVVMTVGFLVFLFLNYYFFLPENAFFFMTGCLAASVRIIACCFPDNHWLSGPLPTTGVRRFRNIPMVLLMLLGFINTMIADFNDSIWLEPAGWFYLPLLVAILGYGAAAEFGPRNSKFYGGMGFLSLAILSLAILGLFL